MELNTSYEVTGLTNATWFNRACEHLEIIQGLLEGSIGKDSFWNPAMSKAEAINIEQRNVLYCLGRIS